MRTTLTTALAATLLLGTASLASAPDTGLQSAFSRADGVGALSAFAQASNGAIPGRTAQANRRVNSAVHQAYNIDGRFVAIDPDPNVRAMILRDREVRGF
jgi:hypothetical protein